MCLQQQCELTPVRWTYSTCNCIVNTIILTSKWALCILFLSYNFQLLYEFFSFRDLSKALHEICFQLLHINFIPSGTLRSGVLYEFCSCQTISSSSILILFLSADFQCSILILFLSYAFRSGALDPFCSCQASSCHIFILFLLWSLRCSSGILFLSEDFCCSISNLLLQWTFRSDALWILFLSSDFLLLCINSVKSLQQSMRCSLGILFPSADFQLLFLKGCLYDRISSSSVWMMLLMKIYRSQNIEWQMV